MNPVRLPHWPYTIFKSSPTPAGLYARQKWLDEAGTAGWQADFAACVAHLRKGVEGLAHLDTPAADRQTERAFTRLVHHQNPDGSWGKQDRQWCTFLAVHALRNRGGI